MDVSRSSRATLLPLLLSCLLLGCRGEGHRNTPEETPAQVRLFAAASLSEVLNDLGNAYTDATGIRVRMNLASSGALARQIRQGARADLFISASPAWTRYLDSLGLIQPPGIRAVAGNRLVLITPKNSPVQALTSEGPWPWEELLSGKRMAIGDPAHVPAGQYALEVLKKTGFPEPSGDYLLPTPDVRGALLVVELGEAQVGLVYATDAMRSGRVRVLATVPDTWHTQIRYTAGVCGPQGLAFLEFLESDAAQDIWKTHGFTQPNG